MSLVINVILVVLMTAVLYKTDIVRRLLLKFNLIEIKAEDAPDYWAIYSWNSCIEKMNFDADIVFIGNSITRGSDFQKSYPRKKIVNLGYSGDTSKRMMRRINSVKSLNPEKVFVMVGINELGSNDINGFAKNYELLVDSIKNSLPAPESLIYLQSILPISREKTKTLFENKIIREANEKIKAIADEKNLIYIDLYSIFEDEGYLPEKYTKDGLHLSSLGYKIWEQSLKDYIN